MMEYDGILKDWSIGVNNSDYYITGNIYEDKKERFYQGSYIRTSKIVFIDFENGIAKTQNSTYKLEV